MCKNSCVLVKMAFEYVVVKEELDLDADVKTEVSSVPADKDPEFNKNIKNEIAVPILNNTR